MKRKKISKKKKYYGFLIDNYVASLALLLVVALFVDANIGFYMMYAFILAPIVSLLLAFVARKYIKVHIEVDEDYYTKGEVCTYRVVLKNSLFLPTPPVMVTFHKESGISNKHDKVFMFAMPFGKRVVTCDVPLDTAGPYEVGIDSLAVCDYLGIFRFRYKSDKDCLSRVYVIPDIKNISAHDDMILSSVSAAEAEDDAEDTVTSSVMNFRGLPGYDTREYVPGDPVKRINWKLSARKGSLYVRLDDEVSSKTLGVILDPVFYSDGIDAENYLLIRPEDVLAKIREEAMETYLGVIRTLLMLSYTVNAYYYNGHGYEELKVTDEKALEELRISLASVYFYGSDILERVSRCPRDLLEKNSDSALVVSTAYSDPSLTNHYAGYTPKVYDASVSVADNYYDYSRSRLSRPTKRQVIISKLLPYILPFVLSCTLSFAVFAVYDVPVLSGWGFLEVMVVAAMLFYAGFVKKHKAIGTLTTIIMVVAVLFFYFSVMSRDYLSYQQWFMSGGDAVDNNSTYLLTIVLLFTSFFALVTYYFTNVLYRLSLLALTSLIPIILYAKVGRDIEFRYVVIIALCNILSLVINNRKVLHTDRYVKDIRFGLVSFGIFFLGTLALVEALPKNKETKYYYVFENLFLGGNFDIILPDDYTEMNERSGNADNFNEYSNRRLYNYYIDSEFPADQVYFKRQTFDYYDFDNDDWYRDEEYNSQYVTASEYSDNVRYVNPHHLAWAIYSINVTDPKALTNYKKMVTFAQNYKDDGSWYRIHVQATNFPSVAFLSTAATIDIDDFDAYVTPSGVFRTLNGAQNAYNYYTVKVYDEINAKKNMISLGGCDMSAEESLAFFEDMRACLSDDRKHAIALFDKYIDMTKNAIEYRDMVADNTDDIPQRVKDLALEITRTCKYDYEKAQALEDYFFENGFKYDLKYKAPDDSVEYFLFEGKTGTCSDFASAYVLMARACGLIVRYVEGFAPSGQGLGNERVIKTTDAHAYPEVFIPGLGFTVYEPTIASEYNGRRKSGLNVDFRFGFVLFRWLGFFAAVIIVSGIAIAVVWPYAKEVMFMLGIKNKEKDIARMYVRLNRSSAWLIKKPQSLTVDQYTKELLEKTAIDISNMSKVVSDVAYRDMEASVKDLHMCKSIYKSSRRRLNRIRLKNRFTKKKKRL